MMLDYFNNYRKNVSRQAAAFLNGHLGNYYTVRTTTKLIGDGNKLTRIYTPCRAEQATHISFLPMQVAREELRYSHPERRETYVKDIDNSLEPLSIDAYNRMLQAYAKNPDATPQGLTDVMTEQLIIGESRPWLLQALSNILQKLRVVLSTATTHNAVC